MKQTRRDFLGTVSASGVAMAVAGASAPGEAAPGAQPATIAEPARPVPVVGEPDVLVAGAGPAGVLAAIAAARSGATVSLVEVAGCAGGIWTSGLLSWILDSRNKRGLLREFRKRLADRGTGTFYGGSLAAEPEVVKLVLEEWCREAGVGLRYHTRVVAADVRDGRLRHVVTESKSGREARAARVFVDATGDGDLAALAGCAFDYGREDTGVGQPMSLICVIAGPDPEEIAPFVRGLAEPAGHGNPKANLLAELRRGGVSPSYEQPFLCHAGNGLFLMMTNHQYAVRGTDADEVTAATLEARAELHRQTEALRGLGGAWRSVRIVTTADRIGVREGRRIRGLYRLTAEDLAAGATFADAVCRCAFPVDVHALDPEKGKGGMRTDVRAKPYDIPYRALVPRDVDGLLLAGRCISGDFIAHSSYRVTGVAAATGEAAGVAAALAAKAGLAPKDVPVDALLRILERKV